MLTYVVVQLGLSPDLGFTPLMAAVYSMEILPDRTPAEVVKTIRCLIKLGADVNTRTKLECTKGTEACTALHLACKKDSLVRVQTSYLLTSG